MPARSKELQAFKDQSEEDRRAKISTTRCLEQLTEVQQEVNEMLEVYVEKENAEGETVLMYKAVNPGRIGALRLKADIALKLLNKRMPDLKAIEHSGEVATPNRLIIERTERSLGKLPGEQPAQDTKH